MLAIVVPDSAEAGEDARQQLQDVLEEELNPALLERAASSGWTLGEFITEALVAAGALRADDEGEFTVELQ